MFRKKLLVSMMAVSLAVSMVPQQSVLAATNPIVQVQDWNVGQTSHGFKVTDVTYSKAYASDVITFEHMKTGATVMWLKNEETDRGFSIGFHTPATNDKGMNHIIEHSLVGGGEKYRSANMLFTLANNTFTSNINAFTAQNYTMYPLSSSSEAQLLKDVDVYLDGVFHPYLLKEKKVFQREAWRYELNDVKDPLTVAGTVYTEMKGNLSDINSAANNYTKKALFGGTDQANQSGGQATDILDLTYEELLETYHKNYHPSNSFVVLYGNLQCENFLKLLDDYFKEYTKQDVSYERVTTKETDHIRKFTYKFPVASGVETTNKSVLKYAMALDDMKDISEESFMEMLMITNILNTETSLMEALKKSGIASSYSFSMDYDTYQPMVYFTASDADESRIDEFQKIIQDELQKFVDEGYNKEFVRSIIKQTQYATALGEDLLSGFNVVTTVTQMKETLGNPMFDVTEGYYQLGKRLDDNCLEKATKKYLLDNKRQALITIKPVAGLQDANERSIELRLAKEKAAMSKKELEVLVADTKAFVEFNNAETPQETLASIKGVEIKDIPYEEKSYETKQEQTLNGTKIYKAKVNKEHVNQTLMSFDVSHLSKEELQYMTLYIKVLSRIRPTKTRTAEVLMNQLVSSTAGVSFSMPYLTDYKTNQGHPAFQAGFYSMDDCYQDVIEIVPDMLLNTVLENEKEEIQSIIEQELGNYNMLITDPLTMAMYHAYSYSSESMAYYDYIQGLSYYQFMAGLYNTMQTDPNSVITKLTEVRDKAFNQEDLQLFFVGDKNSTDLFDRCKDSIASAFPNNKTKAVKLEFAKPAKREAWVIPTDVQYVIYGSSPEKAGVVNKGSYLPLISLIKDQYLTPGIRLNGGAYDCSMSMDDEIYSVFSYRDINYINSLNVIQGVGEFMTQVAPIITEAHLESYILSNLALYTYNQGEMQGAMNAILNEALHGDPNRRAKLVEQLKNTSAKDAVEFAKDIKKLEKEANYLVVLPQTALEGHEDLFDEIIRLY